MKKFEVGDYIRCGCGCGHNGGIIIEIREDDMYTTISKENTHWGVRFEEAISMDYENNVKFVKSLLNVK